MENINDLCFLQIQGKSKFQVELEDYKNKKKLIDCECLHRNELTYEIEKMEDQ